MTRLALLLAALILLLAWSRRRPRWDETPWPLERDGEALPPCDPYLWRQ